jgi:Protein of unknown function (DUF3631)
MVPAGNAAFAYSLVGRPAWHSPRGPPLELDRVDQLGPIAEVTDCRAAFGPHEAIPTTVLLDRLKADPEAPWGEYGAIGLTPMKLGILLREYDIRSETIRFRTGQAKGYRRADFIDAWRRYCPEADEPDELTPPKPYQPYQPYQPSSPPVRLLHAVRLEPYQASTDEMPPAPDADAAGTA